MNHQIFCQLLFNSQGVSISIPNLCTHTIFSKQQFCGQNVECQPWQPERNIYGCCNLVVHIWWSLCDHKSGTIDHSKGVGVHVNPLCCMLCGQLIQHLLWRPLFNVSISCNYQRWYAYFYCLLKFLTQCLHSIRNGMFYLSCSSIQ